MATADPVRPSAPPVASVRPKIELTGTQETLVIPLYARAVDYHSEHSVLHDRWADEMVRSIDYDFGRLSTGGGATLLAARARQLDEWSRAFLATHPDAIVLNLGCGLDSRVERVGPPATAIWFDVDFPEVIALRSEFFADRPGRHLLGMPFSTPGWIERLPKGRPGLIVADGVLQYVAAADVQRLVHRLVDHFGRGELLFDSLSARSIAQGNAHLRSSSGDLLQWSVDAPRTITALDPRLTLRAFEPLVGSPYLPLGFRIFAFFSYLTPGVRRAMRLVRCTFG